MSNSETQLLDKEFQELTSSVYSSLASDYSACQSRSGSLKKLTIQLHDLVKENKNIIGLCIIQNQVKLIKENIDSKDVFPVFQFLLDNNNFKLANELYIKAKKDGDKSLISNISFFFAQYYAKRNEWNKVIQYTEGTFNDLSSQDANYARLLSGISLQKIKKHRQAVKLYLAIPKQSSFYPAARLNIATAYIRQDWWTDAQINIDKALKSKKSKSNNELSNRLYLVQGYSLLQKEFYRDSREAFRNVELNSIYFNKALLGIALTATSQEDYIGALNAINILKAKKEYDLSVDESHILQPYIYEKLNQNMTASASYTAAQKYYQDRIESINIIKEQLSKTNDVNNIKYFNTNIHIKDNIFENSSFISDSLLENTSLLNNLLTYIPGLKNIEIKHQFNTFKVKHDRLIKDSLNNILDQRIGYLRSYLNQSRFGLARLFDNSNKVSN